MFMCFLDQGELREGPGGVFGLFSLGFRTLLATKGGYPPWVGCLKGVLILRAPEALLGALETRRAPWGLQWLLGSLRIPI